MTAQAYTSNAAVKTRLGITNTDDDGLLATIATQVNSWLEMKIGFPVGPVTSEERMFDSSVVRDGGYCLPVYPWGVRAISAITTADATDGTETSRTTTDVVLRPHSHERETDWPAFEIWIKDNVSWIWPTYGVDVIGITATWGWAAIPSELQSIADRLAIAAWRGRSHGTGSQYMVAEDVEAVAAEELSSTDWRTIFKFKNLIVPFDLEPTWR